MGAAIDWLTRTLGNFKVRAWWLVLACVMSFLYALPILYLLAFRVPLLIVGNESLAYRYFGSLRILDHDSGFVFMPQGHLLGVGQHLINLALTHLCQVPIEDLEIRLNAFGYATLLANALVISVVLVRAFWLAFGWTDKFLLGVVALAPVYGTRGSGVDFSVKPDYYVLEITLATLAVFLFVRQVRSSPAGHRMLALVHLGAVVGLMASNKITLIPLGLIAAWPAVVAAPCSPKQVFSRICLAGGVAAGTFLGVIWAFYLFSSNALPEFFKRWISFLRNPGGEAGFWSALLSSPEANPYMYLLTLWLAMHIGVGWVEWRRSGLRSPVVLLITFVLLMGFVHGVALVQRPANTTLFETVLFMLSSAAITICAIPSGRVRQVVAAGLILMVGSYSLLSGPLYFQRTLPVEEFVRNGQNIWDIHRWVMGHRRTVTVFIPDNSYGAGTVEEALMKGMSDLPTWNITTGSSLLERLAPGITFRQTLTTVLPNSVLLWLEKPEVPSLRERMPVLREEMARPSSICREWKLGRHSVVACLVSSAGANAPVGRS